jgi:hypothetical protein
VERRVRVMKQSKCRRFVTALAIAAALVTSAGGAVAEEERGYWSQAGLGFGAILSNLVYMPVKITYATLGAVTGGLTYALTGGSYDPANAVWVASLGGTYVITPDMLTGQKPVEFAGTPAVRTASAIEEPAPVAGSQAPSIGEGYAHDGF